MANETIGMGTTITFTTTHTSITYKWNQVAGPELTRAAIDSTHLGTTGGKTYIQSDVYDGGTITGTCQWDATVNGATAFGEGAATFTIDPAALGAGKKITGSCFITKFGPIQFGQEEMMTADCEFKVSGSVLFAQS